MTGTRSLLFDIGNTRIKWGVLEQSGIRRSGSIAHEKLREVGYRALTTRLPRRVDHVYACNVAGSSIATRMAGVIGIHCETDIHFVHVERAAHGITNGYRQFRKLGVDRWVEMIGARAEFRSALCVVDAGTAVTIDAIDKSGQHLGGQIMPGLRLMANALESDTSDITVARQKSTAPAKGMAVFAGTTGTAIHNGAMSAVCGAIEGAVRLLRSSGHRPKIVLTGGDASRILKQVGIDSLHRPNLVLQGLGYILQSEL